MTFRKSWGLQTLDDVLHQGLGGLQGEAVHGAGDVHDEDVFPGQDRLRLDLGRRLHHQQEKVFILAGIEQEPAVDLVAGQGVAQDKILIARGLFVLDLDLGRRFARSI